MRLSLRRLARSPLAYWAAVVALSCFTAVTVAGQVGKAEAQAARYGRLRPVVTATRAVEAGSVLRAADVAVRSVPAAFVPEGALASADVAVGRTVVVPVFRGGAVVDAQLAPDGLGGLAALLPPASRAGPSRWPCGGATGSTCWPPSTRRPRARSRRSPWPRPPWWSTWGRRRWRWPFPPPTLPGWPTPLPRAWSPSPSPQR